MGFFASLSLSESDLPCATAAASLLREASGGVGEEAVSTAESLAEVPPVGLELNFSTTKLGS